MKQSKPNENLRLTNKFVIMTTTLIFLSLKKLQFVKTW